MINSPSDELIGVLHLIMNVLLAQLYHNHNLIANT